MLFLTRIAGAGRRPQIRIRGFELAASRAIPGTPVDADGRPRRHRGRWHHGRLHRGGLVAVHGANGGSIHRAILPPELVNHEFRPIVELDAEPVPSRLAGSELIRRPFVIEPADTGHIVNFSAEANRSVSRQSRD